MPNPTADAQVIGDTGANEELYYQDVSGVGWGGVRVVKLGKERGSVIA